MAAPPRPVEPWSRSGITATICYIMNSSLRYTFPAIRPGKAAKAQTTYRNGKRVDLSDQKARDDEDEARARARCRLLEPVLAARKEAKQRAKKIKRELEALFPTTNKYEHFETPRQTRPQTQEEEVERYSKPWKAFSRPVHLCRLDVYDARSPYAGQALSPTFFREDSPAKDAGMSPAATEFSDIHTTARRVLREQDPFDIMTGDFVSKCKLKRVQQAVVHSHGMEPSYKEAARALDLRRIYLDQQLGHARDNAREAAQLAARALAFAAEAEMHTSAAHAAVAQAAADHACREAAEASRRAMAVAVMKATVHSDRGLAAAKAAAQAAEEAEDEAIYAKEFTAECVKAVGQACVDCSERSAEYAEKHAREAGEAAQEAAMASKECALEVHLASAHVDDE